MRKNKQKLTVGKTEVPIVQRWPVLNYLNVIGLCARTWNFKHFFDPDGKK